jgi:hypothetical protein
MMADAERLDGGQLFDSQSSSSVELCGRQSKAFTHAAINMHAQRPQSRAAVSAAGEAGVALAAREKWIHARDVAG